MKKDTNCNVERIIAKIDNDFNLDNTDWVPRIAAWVIDCLSILKVTPTEKKKIKVNVKDRIAYGNCCFGDEFKVYDKNGCEIESSDECSACHSFTGREEEDNGSTEEISLSNTMCYHKSNNEHIDKESLAVPINKKVNPTEYQVLMQTSYASEGKYYTKLDDNKIELNFDADYIYVEYESIITAPSKVFGCDLPVIPNNGLLIEAITYYCMYKILCRGIKHPVFNLKASQYGTNPYYMWTELKDKAKRSVLIGDGEIDDKHAWDTAMIQFMFN